MLDQPTMSADNHASSSYEGGLGFALGDGPGRWSGMHALPRPVHKYKLPRPEGSPGRKPPAATRTRQAAARRRRQRRCVHILQTDNSTTKSQKPCQRGNIVSLSPSLQINTGGQQTEANTKATSNSRINFTPTIVLEIPFCVEKRKIKNSHTATQI